MMHNLKPASRNATESGRRLAGFIIFIDKGMRFREDLEYNGCRKDGMV